MSVSGFRNIITDQLVYGADAFNNICDNVTNVKNMADPTITGAFVNGASVVNGLYNFDGVDDEIRVTNFPFPYGANSFTVEMWARKATNDTERNIASDWEAGGFGFTLRHQRIGSTLRYRWTAGNNTPIATGQIDGLSMNHIVGIYDNSTNSGYIYINGVLRGSNVGGWTTLPTKPPTLPLEIGGNAATGFGRWYGDIAMFRFHGKALSVDEINHNYDVMKHRFD
jgi:hypothetical protein